MCLSMYEHIYCKEEKIKHHIMCIDSVCRQIYTALNKEYASLKANLI